MSIILSTMPFELSRISLLQKLKNRAPSFQHFNNRVAYACNMAERKNNHF